eukprot:Blabericola_migrator_1__493@NODE_111_length_13907_cov_66_898049_g99_i0_p1_GENE_NODE_111_length_13907_cov_66_898049_g99_i0NODE_111_length_13907_cov_66_898049_g99_i0_p1_ORF_typecomplete_len2994_score576_76Ribonuclease_3/PF00636_26/5_6e18Ribonuclease_3/PF00636_26/8_8e14Ribonucleas_3_3/PF14622_6/8_9e13Ribonucleas_3_3/PF14622_6/2_9e06ResIII/PF04851_15/1_2e14Helicase_C/PF00271_31/2_4e12DEAD/PF00270_29/0_00083DEAD/PF00270_29/3_3e05ERCC3_RAD25_C/PF16203_5/0_0092ERCC3_RAD25_C/PF16203_5/1_1e03Flavi_DEAD/P
MAPPLVVRDYQKAIYDHAKTANTIAILPTNSGKTLIASQLAYAYLSLPGFFDKIVIFLTPTVILARQQRKAIRRDFGGLTGIGDIDFGSDVLTYQIPKSKEKIGSTSFDDYEPCPEWTSQIETRVFAGNRGTTDINVGASWNHADTWEEMFQDLREYKQRVEAAFKERLAPPTEKFMERSKLVEKGIRAQLVEDELRAAAASAPGSSEDIFAEDELANEEETAALDTQITGWPRLFVMPPDKFLKYLQHGAIKMSDIALLVIDECHHCSDGSPYSIIMREYYHMASLMQQHTSDVVDLSAAITRPRILGLTASPIKKKVDMRAASMFSREAMAGKIKEELRHLVKTYDAGIHIGKIPGQQWDYCWFKNKPVDMTENFSINKFYNEWKNIINVAVLIPIQRLLKNFWKPSEPAHGKSHLTDYVPWADPYQSVGPLISSEARADPLWFVMHSEERSTEQNQEFSDLLSWIRGYDAVIFMLEKILMVARGLPELSEYKDEETPERYLDEVSTNSESTTDSVEAPPPTAQQGIDTSLEWKRMSERKKKRLEELEKALERRNKVFQLIQKTLEHLQSCLSDFGVNAVIRTSDWRLSQEAVRRDDEHSWTQWSLRFNEILHEMGLWGLHEFICEWYTHCGRALYAHYSRTQRLQKIFGVADQFAGSLDDLRTKTAHTRYTQADLNAPEGTDVMGVDFTDSTSNSEFLRLLIIEKRLRQRKSRNLAELYNQAVRQMASDPSLMEEDRCHVPMYVKLDIVWQPLDPLVEVVRDASDVNVNHVLAQLVSDNTKRHTMLLELLTLCRQVCGSGRKLAQLEVEGDTEVHELNLMKLLRIFPQYLIRARSNRRQLQKQVCLKLYEAFLSRHPVIAEKLLEVTAVQPTDILIAVERQTVSKPAWYSQYVTHKLSLVEDLARRLAWESVYNVDAAASRRAELEEISKRAVADWANVFDKEEKTEGLKFYTVQQNDEMEDSDVSLGEEPDLMEEDDVDEEETLDGDDDDDTYTRPPRPTHSDFMQPNYHDVDTHRRNSLVTSSLTTEQDFRISIKWSPELSVNQCVKRTLQATERPIYDSKDLQGLVDIFYRATGRKRTMAYTLHITPSEIPKEVADVTLLSADIKILVFCTKRLTCWILSHYLNSRVVGRSGWITGLSSASQSTAYYSASAAHKVTKVETGIRPPTQEEQRSRVEKFAGPSDGRHTLQIMVATTVIEEGFDLPDCNAVIRFNLPATLAQHIQSRGRARRPGSQYFLLGDNTTLDAQVYLRGYTALEGLVIACCDAFRRGPQRVTSLTPEDREKLIQEIERFNLFDAESGVYIPYSLAPRALNDVIQVLAAYTDDGESGLKGLPREPELRRWLISRGAHSDKHQLVAFHAGDKKVLVLPPVRGHREEIFPMQMIKLQDPTLPESQASFILALRGLTLWRKAGVLDARFLPPMPIPPEISLGRYKKLKRSDNQANVDALWREAPWTFGHPVPLHFDESEMFVSHRCQELLRGDAVYSGISQEKILETTLLLDEGNVAFKGVKHHERSDFMVEKETAQTTTDTSTQAPQEKGNVFVLYPHHVIFRATTWHSEVLKSGGLYGFWKLHYQPDSTQASRPPDHMLQFIGETYKEEVEANLEGNVEPDDDPFGTNTIPVDDEEDEATDDPIPKDIREREAAAKEALRELRALMHLRARAQRYGSAIYERMEEHLDDSSSGPEAPCCQYPGIRLSAERDPLAVLQPQTILLRSPLPVPITLTMKHSSNGEVIHVTIKPITKQYLHDTDWINHRDDAKDKESLVKILERDMQEAELVGNFSHEAQQLAEWRQPIAYQLPSSVVLLLTRLRQVVSHCWAIKNFNLATHHLLRQRTIEGRREAQIEFSKADADISLLQIPFVCFAPLCPDGVSLDLDYAVRFLYMQSWMRSGNIRDTYSQAQLSRIEETTPPSLLEIYEECPDLVPLFDPANIYRVPAVESSGQPPRVSVEKWSLTHLYCPHKGVDNKYYIADVVGYGRGMISDLPYLCHPNFRPAVVQFFDQRVTRLESRIRSPPQLTLLYAMNPSKIAELDRIKDKSYRGEPLKDQTMAVKARSILFHSLLRGSESPVFRMTHQRACNFHFYRICGLGWNQRPEDILMRVAQKDLASYYVDDFEQTVSEKNTFIFYGDKIRQGPRLAIVEELHPRKDNCHAPQFVSILPFSEPFAQFLSCMPSIFWKMDVALKHMECKLLLDFTFSRKVPKRMTFFGRKRVEDRDEKLKTGLVWTAKRGDTTLKIKTAEHTDFNVDFGLVRAALTTLSSTNAKDLEWIELRQRIAIFDLWRCRFNSAEAMGTAFLLAQLAGTPVDSDRPTLDGSTSSSLRRLFGHVQEMVDLHPLESAMQLFYEKPPPNQYPKTLSPYATFYFFPSPPLRMQHNQVLEFVGDAVLKYVAGVWAFFAYQDADEGELSKISQALKTNKALRDGVRKHRLHSFLLSRQFTVKGAASTVSDLRSQSVSFKQQADVLEALLGAVYWSHYHRFDLWSGVSDMFLFDLVSKWLPPGQHQISIDAVGALGQPFFLGKDWCGSSAGCFACAFVIEAYVQGLTKYKDKSLVQVFSLLRDLAADDLLDPRSHNVKRRVETFNPKMQNVMDIPSIKTEESNAVVELKIEHTQDDIYTDHDLKASWPNGLITRAPLNLNFDDEVHQSGEIKQSVTSYFPSSMGLIHSKWEPLCFDVKLRGPAADFCSIHMLPMRFSDADFLDAWFANTPSKTSVRPEVRQLVSSARLHKTAQREINDIEDFQRLEFLGDSALALLLTEWLQKAYPDAREGPLSYARAILQSNRFLCRVMCRKLLRRQREPIERAAVDASDKYDIRMEELISDTRSLLPSRLMYYESGQRKKWQDLDDLQLRLIKEDEEGLSDFTACREELAFEDVQRLQKQQKQQDDEEMTSPGADVSFNRYKDLADVYEAMVAVTLFEYRFDLRAVWEVIKGDFINNEKAITDAINDTSFLIDAKGQVRAESINEMKSKIKSTVDALRAGGESQAVHV